MSTILRPQVAILSLRERPAWKALQQHHAKMQNLREGNVWAEVTIVMLPLWAGALADYSQSRKQHRNAI